jgi:pyruvate dehydrogenase E2 component (dihydrolipoamide acetyltransferase)
VRRLARELGVDIHDVQGSGLGGRISEDDVKKHTKQVVQAAASGTGSQGGGAAATTPLPDFSKWGNVERQPLSGIRTATAQQMSRAWVAPHVTQFDKADITDLETMRKLFGKRAEERGGKLTVTAISLKVVVAALKRFPQFNSSLDLGSKELVLKQYFHIGVAVDTENGLLVPVIRDVDKKSVFDLATELSEVSEKARARKIGMEDMQGGCFTITNVGGIGGTAFTPIVNVPEVAILGIARGQMEAKWNGTEFQPRLMLPLSLSYDHRVIDGADGARFVRFIADMLEQPILMTFEG